MARPGIDLRNLLQFFICRPGSCGRSLAPVGSRVRKKGSFGKGVFSEKSIFYLEILESLRLKNLEILEILENPQTVENKGESDHF